MGRPVKEDKTTIKMGGTGDNFLETDFRIKRERAEGGDYLSESGKNFAKRVDCRAFLFWEVLVVKTRREGGGGRSTIPPDIPDVWVHLR